MIISEKNLIIGNSDTIISSLSKSTFFYIEKQINYIFKYIFLLSIKINPRSTSPPLNFIF